MKSFAAVLALAPLAMGLALPEPDHMMTIEATCVDPAPTATVTVTETVERGSIVVTATETVTVERGSIIVGGTLPAGFPTFAPPAPPTVTGALAPTQANGEPRPQQTFEVMVAAFPRGEGQPPSFEFRPNFVHAELNDVVNFRMMIRNHSVTESTFDTPCIRKPGGFDTGLIAIDSNENSEIRRFEVTDVSRPQWFYCKQRMGNHCGSGMVFGLNPPSPERLQTFISEAIRQNGTQAAGGASTMASAPAAAVTSVGGYVANAMQA